MDKTYFEELKNQTEYEKAADFFLDLVRGQIRKEEYLDIVISASTLAIALKEQNDVSPVEEINKVLKDETVLRSLKATWERFSREIKEYSEKYTIDDLRGVVLFTEPRLYSEINVSQTPEGIVNLAIKLLDISKSDKVLDLGSGGSSFLMQATLESKTKNNYGVELNQSNIVISKLRQYVTQLPIEIISGNMISKDYSHLEANKVFSDFPFGMRYRQLEEYMKHNKKLKSYFEESGRTVSGDWVYAMAAYLNTKQPGRTVFLMSNGGTFNSGDTEFRRHLIEQKVIEGIIQLPANLLSSTAIPITMVVLSENNTDVKMVDASEIYTSERRKNVLKEKDIQMILDAYDKKSEISRAVTHEEIKNKDYILYNPHYIGLEDIVHGIELDEITSNISRGSMIKSSELDELISDQETNYRYLMLQNIQDGRIDSNLPPLERIDDKHERYCINDKNLIISKNAPFKIALAHVEEDEKILANGNLYFLELDEEKINPTFALAYLQSEKGQSQLNRLSKGSVMKNISIKDLKKVQIPNLDKKKQDEIAAEYNELNERLIMLEKQIELVREKRKNLVEEGI
ncbi:N-6 DNA methylase [Alkalibacterium putridalgicola]|uniref:N-6 DNA methylase n=1 Tax=Alkalibacterium putridalgicola TaxID=426703 RepID=UPI0034CD9583